MSARVFPEEISIRVGEPREAGGRPQGGRHRPICRGPQENKKAEEGRIRPLGSSQDIRLLPPSEAGAPASPVFGLRSGLITP